LRTPLSQSLLLQISDSSYIAESLACPVRLAAKYSLKLEKGGKEKLEKGGKEIAWKMMA